MSVEMIPAGYLPHPAKCVSCGDTDRDCLYFGHRVEGFGVILLCTSCVSYAVKEFGLQLGVASLEEYTSVAGEAESLRSQVNQVPKALEGLRASLDLAQRQFDDELRAGGLVPEPAEVPGPSPEPTEQPARPGRGKTHSPGKGRAGERSGVPDAADRPVEASDGPAGEQGPADIPSDLSEFNFGLSDFAADF